MSGEKAKPVMLASKLPVDALGKIWNLSDIDADGKLDVDEFAVVSGGREGGRKEGRKEGREREREGGRKGRREGGRKGGREKGREGGREGEGRNEFDLHCTSVSKSPSWLQEESLLLSSQ